jgi:hypothetical protein
VFFLDELESVAYVLNTRDYCAKSVCQIGLVLTAYTRV